MSGNPTDEFAAFLARDREKYAQRVKLANVRLG